MDHVLYLRTFFTPQFTGLNQPVTLRTTYTTKVKAPTVLRNTSRKFPSKFFTTHIHLVDRDSSVDTATRYGLDGPGI
jgi:hypothetical protein